MSKWIIIFTLLTAAAYELELYNDCDGYVCEPQITQPTGTHNG